MLRIDRLEPVEINQHDRGTQPFVGAGALHGMPQAVEKQRAIGDARQTAIHRVMDEPLMRALRFGDVPNETNEPVRSRIGSGKPGSLDLKPSRAVVGMTETELCRQRSTLLALHSHQRKPQALAVGLVHVLQKLGHLCRKRPRCKAEHVIDHG